MGSLMAGWDAHLEDPKTVMLKRNKSLTKEEIAAFWKSKGGGASPSENQENMDKEPVERRYQRSNSSPLIDRRESSASNNGGSNSEADAADKLLPKANCWWTRSNWAFLNEPPVIKTEGTQRYTPQFHVAKLGVSKIST